jgi:hypothetical protein
MSDTRQREPDAVLGLCDDCRRPSFIDVAPSSLIEAVAQAARYDRMPKIVPVGEAMRRWRAGVCECVKGKIAREREAGDA